MKECYGTTVQSVEEQLGIKVGDTIRKVSGNCYVGDCYILASTPQGNRLVNLTNGELWSDLHVMGQDFVENFKKVELCYKEV